MKFAKNDGFTLVELIVVIAILAILAGAAVPAYSGYISSANKGLDQTLVGDIVYAASAANYVDALEGSATIILQNGTNAVVTGGDAEAAAWLHNAMVDAFGPAYASEMQLKYDKWGNGVAVSKVMLDALSSGKAADAMNKIYGNADNLSFTEEIPELLEEIKNVAIGVAGPNAKDEGVITIVNGAAAVTSTWDVAAIQNLWQGKISYDGSNYSGYDSFVSIPSGTGEFEEKLTVAGVVRAKNTCLAMYAKENGFAEYYDALAGYSAPGGMAPLDITNALSTPEGQQDLAKACGLDLSNQADREKATAMTELLSGYYSASDSNGGKVYQNDAAAYFAMMGIVDTMSKDDSVDKTNLDNYFNAASGPASMFQELVSGTVTLDDLSASLSGVSAGGNNVSVTFATQNGVLIWVVGPTTVLAD